MKITKDKAINIHFTRRMEERYGLKINRRVRAELVKWIKRGKAVYLERISNNRSMLEVPIFLSGVLVKDNENVKFGDKLVMIYDKKRQRLITVLPGRNYEDAIHAEEEKQPATNYG